MELLFSHHLSGGCSQWREEAGGALAEARPPCAVLARALRDNAAHPVASSHGRC
ncbi:hypothetical protein V5740_04490 [Croceibacterium sp. TMG7-5b_MA50]|uniref:hypothetical protein n=1 Tax=Croceibacterium sp. TMG7-5b_MA50 TaxID=3121290 RepID=UPI0032213FF8